MVPPSDVWQHSVSVWFHADYCFLRLVVWAHSVTLCFSAFLILLEFWLMPFWLPSNQLSLFLFQRICPGAYALSPLVNLQGRKVNLEYRCHTAAPPNNRSGINLCVQQPNFNIFIDSLCSLSSLSAKTKKSLYWLKHTPRPSLGR
jgi:hypothetical protein